MLIAKGIEKEVRQITRPGKPRIICEHCGGKGWLPTPETLRAEREKKGLTLTAVAAEMGVPKSRLSSLETGRWDWNAELVRKFREAIARLNREAVQ
jgi:hypothetical protein